MLTTVCSPPFAHQCRETVIFASIEPFDHFALCAAEEVGRKISDRKALEHRIDKFLPKVSFQVARVLIVVPMKHKAFNKLFDLVRGRHVFEFLVANSFGKNGTRNDFVGPLNTGRISFKHFAFVCSRREHICD